MFKSLSLLGTQLKEIWRHLGVNQKVSTLLALAVTISVIGGLFFWSSRPDYRLLYTGVSLKDAAAMQEKLSDAKISVQLKDSGRAIYVPAKDVYRGRLLLAEAGLPKDTSIGFEIFEQPKFGLTDFAQQVNYQRALQGELERTIAAIDGVESSRVMLVLPKERVFSTDAKNRASASILVTVGGGTALGSAHVQSIVQLVASAVPGLSPTDITVTDQSGRLLTKPTSGSDFLEDTDEQLSVQEKVGAGLARKAQELLDVALGAGKSIVKVSTTMDFTKREKRTENYDSQNKVVKSETIESENTTSPAQGSGGAAGAVSVIPIGNLSGATTEQSGNMSKSKKENVRTEYAIPSDVEQTVIKGGQIVGLSASVCLAKGEKARSADEVKQIEQIVRNAIGFVENDKRKDSIEVAEMDFPKAPVTVPPAMWQRAMPDWELIKTVGAWVAALLVMSMVGRRITRNLDVRQEDVGIPLQSVAIGAAPEDRSFRSRPLGDGPISSEKNIGMLHEVAEQNPKAIAAWIRSISDSGT
jgi:flagellar M-ring protein FliF